MGPFSQAERTDDASLITGFALGEEAASAAFVRRFQHPVYGLAFSVTRDQGLAEDVSQKVFVRVWRAAGIDDPAARHCRELRAPVDRVEAGGQEAQGIVARPGPGGRTAADIGRHESIPVGTAKTCIRTGLRRPRDSMKEESHD